MNDDPIVDEVRRAGDEYFKRFNYDLKAAFAELRRRTEELRKAGRKVVSRPPRLTAAAGRAKKAG